MKTAEERAAEACDVAHSAGVPRAERVARIARMFKEYARDQRHLCAEAVTGLAAEGERARAGMEPNLYDAHAAVMNTPFPGEDR